MLYFGLIDEKISLSDKDLPVHGGVWATAATSAFLGLCAGTKTPSEG